MRTPLAMFYNSKFRACLASAVRSAIMESEYERGQRMDFTTVDGGVTTPLGYRAAGVAVGIKREGLDMAVLVSDQPAACAGVFTRNLVQAAPVVYSRAIVAGGQEVRAVVVNSGNANACTGGQGQVDTERTAVAAAKKLGVAASEVLVASTGVIGVPLPMEKVLRGVDEACVRLAAGPDAGRLAAAAIMTTDTYMKQVAVTLEVEGVPVTIGGMAKGSGMIHPDMATMLSFVTTDAAIAPDLLQRLLRESAEDTYNMISVDGDTSTNDMVLVLANGQSGAPRITESSRAYASFRDALHYVHMDLARQIVRDGEGATKLVEVEVQGAKSVPDARRLVKTVLTSNLVKTAFFGEDANWGRILAAMGRSGANFDPQHVSITFSSDGGTIELMRDSQPLRFDEDEAKQVLQPSNVRVLITLCDGNGAAMGWGCDLSYEYVRINGDYRT